MRAVLFPGQGSQFVGMGKDLLKKSKSAKDVYEQVNESLGRDLTKIIFNGSEKELNEIYTLERKIQNYKNFRTISGPILSDIDKITKK